MKKLLLFLFLFAVVVSATCQIPMQKTLVADETWVMASGQSAFRVITTNDSISQVFRKTEGVTKVTAYKKEDRHGQYWEISYYFKDRSWNSIVAIIKELNKPKK